MICSICLAVEPDAARWATAFTVINGHAACGIHSVYVIHEPAYRAAVALALTKKHHPKN